ncbi:MAG: iron chelate uptake ABC transporter family permease subunit [Microbacteriaceae bacterium]
MTVTTEVPSTLWRDDRTHRRRRATRISLTLTALVLLVAAGSLAIGAYTLPLPDVITTLAGQGEARDNFIVFGLRLPRLLLGALVGAAFAISGALFQTLLKNPLASPDIIGISGGASAAAAYSILFLGLSGAAVPLAAFLGALAAATAIYLLAWRGGVTGYRFVLIGVGVAFMMQAVLGYLITRGDVRDVQQALVWMVGGIGGASWVDIVVLALTLAVLLPAVGLFVPRIRMLQLGDDTAGGLGVRVESTRLTLLVIAVALAAVTTAFAGPVAFVAFVSAPIARRLIGTGSLALVPSALVGILLVTAADFVAQHLLPGTLQVPVGIITGVVGAPYLLWLLATANRRGRGA